MIAHQVSPAHSACPPTREELQQQIQQRLDEIIVYCLRDPGPMSFLDFEKTLLGCCACSAPC
jgi:hypothetical protein